MNKIIFVFFLGVMGLLGTAPKAAEAQSTAEYSTLTSGVAAASKAEKEKGQNQGQEEQQGSSAGGSGLAAEAMKKVYGDSADALSTKGGSLLGQVGEGEEPKAAPKPAPQAKIIEPENTETQAPENTSGNKGNPTVKVTLRSGTVVEGELIERKEDHIKVNTAGFPVTYFNEEITRIEEAPEAKK